MIQKSTFSFLRSLEANNNRDWFMAHKDEYEESRQNVTDFAAKLIEIISKTDPAVPGDLAAKNCVFRIYRDVRFSKNKTPYKNNFGIGISPKGKSFEGASYYIQVQPGNSFIAAGDWQPAAERLKAIRQEIDYNGSEFHSIVDEKSFRKYFNNLSTEDKLKTAPKGYPPDHDDIEYLKLKSFIVIHHLSDSSLVKADLGILKEIFESVNPFIMFLRNAIT